MLVRATPTLTSSTIQHMMLRSDTTYLSYQLHKHTQSQDNGTIHPTEYPYSQQAHKHYVPLCPSFFLTVPFYTLSGSLHTNYHVQIQPWPTIPIEQAIYLSFL